MRYIPKLANSPARQLLDNAKEEMKKAGISILYENFNDKKNLNDLLRDEQKRICCYCQKRIDHFQGANISGSHNEHFEPENGPDGRADLQMEYENIYACCNTTKGYEKRLQHCGEHKDKLKINRNFLLMRNCSDYFKYNVNGEILPTCPYNSYNDVLNNRTSLTSIQLDSLQMIEVLNLNVASLTTFRKEVLSDVMNYLKDKTAGQVAGKIQILNNEKMTFVPMIDMVLYFLKLFVSKHP